MPLLSLWPITFLTTYKFFQTVNTVNIYQKSNSQSSQLEDLVYNDNFAQIDSSFKIWDEHWMQWVLLIQIFHFILKYCRTNDVLHNLNINSASLLSEYSFTQSVSLVLISKMFAFSWRFMKEGNDTVGIAWLHMVISQVCFGNSQQEN